MLTKCHSAKAWLISSQSSSVFGRISSSLQFGSSSSWKKRERMKVTRELTRNVMVGTALISGCAFVDNHGRLTFHELRLEVTAGGLLNRSLKKKSIWINSQNPFRSRSSFVSSGGGRFMSVWASASRLCKFSFWAYSMAYVYIRQLSSSSRHSAAQRD